MEKTAEYLLGNNNIIMFPKLGIEFNIPDVAFSIFGFDIKWYGVLIALGMVLAMVYCFKRMKEFGIDADRAIDVVIFGVIAAMLGARAYYIMFDDSKTFADFFSFRDGGLAIYGGLIAALVVAAVVAKIRKVKLFPLFDIASIGFLIGQCIGRWGNFVNKEAFGSLTELPWGMAASSIQYELGSVAASAPIATAHPCFLYESLWCAIGFILLHLYVKHRKFDGEIFLLYAAWYGFGRFFIESLRTDSLLLGRLRISQVLAAACVVTAVLVIIFVRSHYKRMGESPVLYRDTAESKELLILAAEKIAAEKEKKANKAQKDAQNAVKIAKIAEKTASGAAKEAQKANKNVEKMVEERVDDNGKTD